MTSIRQVQISRALDSIERVLYSTGVKPSNYDVSRSLSKYFSEHPAGKPLGFDASEVVVDGAKSDPEAINDMMLRLLINFDVLYDVTMKQSKEVMDLMTEMTDSVKLLQKKRREVNRDLDNILHSIGRTDGYLYSVSDDFSDISMTDLRFTSAYVDSEAGYLTLPVTSYLSKRLPSNSISESSLSISFDEQNITPRVISPFTHALDGLNNTVWHVEATTSSVGFVTAVLEIDIDEAPEISRIDIDPFGVTPAQWAVEYGYINSNGEQEFEPFGYRVRKSSDRIYYNSPAVNANKLRFTITKDEHDYEEVSGGQVRYRYIFGAKEIAVHYQFYDAYASYVSEPLSVNDLGGFRAIDSVSISADRTVPDGTTLKMFVAEDEPEATRISDFAWREISPVDERSNPNLTVVRFDGAESISSNIVPNPRSNAEIQRIPLDNIDPDLKGRNPTTAILDGDLIYRICEMKDDPIVETMRLEEGVDTIEISHSILDDSATDGLDWWGQSLGFLEVTSGTLDGSYDFFHGKDVGEPGRSVKVDAKVDVGVNPQTVMSNLRKSNANAKTWKVRAFLNGREVGFMDNDEQQIPVTWTFKGGLNHITLLINIPKASDEIPHPYLGSIVLMDGTSLTDLGIVRLGTLAYVDMFDMKHNQRYGDKTFSIHDGEIVSRRNVQGKLRLTYSRETGDGPDALRVRVDMSRSKEHSTVTPVLEQYRLRFSYGLEVL